ncbi:DUF1715-domain-containing protein [Phialemonium atrogriseum]|uniref:DUF1715-domain-containing protein n=1 Tax=Phialemonium atrogriseum TaxID=1093897 RepID=A0AAJ0CAV0_9PEZI|nr:DUF1715-domain-containing protein [Phialemonium atrogriseum]KAK1770901.1 DUF1715-domain-containing protein [Phialemonium atrogriseum]
MADDPFDGVLNLEEQFYQEGYKQGLEDGIKAGRIEGRSFGLEKGFEKFLESGRLHGKAVIWANRLPNLKAKSATQPESHQMASGQPESSGRSQQPERHSLPLLPRNPRLEKNVTVLYALVEPETLSTENTDEAVDDFDDRIKRAQGKAKIIERTIGEDSGRSRPQESTSPARR